MKALVTRRSIVIASTALLIALVAIISVNVFNSAGPVTGLANTITRPVRALVSTVARTFGTIYSSIYRYEDLERRYEEILRENVRLHANFRDAAVLAEENDRLRDLLELRERHGGHDYEPAVFQSWNSDNWSHSFVINRGYSNANISRGMPVITEYGVLIGQVTEVSATQSIVITVLDTTFSVAVFIGGDSPDNSDGTATAKGDFTQMRQGFMILDYIDDDLSILPGAEVVTSGYGGIFPSGLSVGKVVRVYNHASGIGRYAIVEPTRDLSTIQDIWVITEFANPD